MDYFEMKLSQRLVTDPGATNPQKEEALFYANYGEKTRIFTRFLEILAFWTKAPEIEVSSSSPRSLRKARA